MTSDERKERIRNGFKALGEGDGEQFEGPLVQSSRDLH